MTTPTPEVKCLFCDWTMNAATGIDNDGTPEEGCLSICLRCGAVAIFDRDLQLRGLNDDEISSLMANPGYLRKLSRMIRGRAFFLRQRIKEAS